MPCRSQGGNGTTRADDVVEHPSHYTQGDVECIDAIRSALTGVEDPFLAFCAGQVIRYTWRHAHKGSPITDLEKARQYLDWAIEHLEGDNSTDD